MSTWAIHESGMVSQSIADMTDSSIILFTDTAMDHNQAIQDAKEAAR